MWKERSTHRRAPVGLLATTGVDRRTADPKLRERAHHAHLSCTPRAPPLGECSLAPQLDAASMRQGLPAHRLG